MTKKGLTQVAIILLVGFIFLAFFIVGNKLGIVGSTPDIKDKIAAIDCGNDDFCGTKDDLNSDDTLIFEEGHKIDTVLQFVPVNLCSNRDPNGIVGCGSSGPGMVRSLINVSVKLDGKPFNVKSDRLVANGLKSIDRKLEIFYTWQVNYNNEGRYAYDSSSGNYYNGAYLNGEGYRLCLKDGLCKKEYGSIVFRVEPKGQGATTTIPRTSTSTIRVATSTTIEGQPTTSTIYPTDSSSTTTIKQQETRQLTFIDKIIAFFKRIFS